MKLSANTKYFTHSCLKNYYQQMRDCLEDPRKAERLAAQQCNRCFYFTGRIAGQAFTNSKCGACGLEMQFSSTDVNRLCKECAVENNACERCMVDIDFVDKLPSNK